MLIVRPKRACRAGHPNPRSSFATFWGSTPVWMEPRWCVVWSGHCRWWCCWRDSSSIAHLGGWSPQQRSPYSATWRVKRSGLTAPWMRSSPGWMLRLRLPREPNRRTQALSARCDRRSSGGQRAAQQLADGAVVPDHRRRAALRRVRDPQGRRPFQHRAVRVEWRPVHRLIAHPACSGGVASAVTGAGLMPHEDLAGAELVTVGASRRRVDDPRLVLCWVIWCGRPTGS